MPRLASASVTVSLRAKDGADGKPGADGAPARYVYLRGTGYSSQHFDGVTSATTPALIKTSGGETDLSISSRGLTVVTLDRQTLRVASRQTFDTLTDSVARNQQLADHLAAQDDSVFLCIVSCDAFYLSKSKGGDVVIEALKAFGLGAVDRARLDYRCPFAFLGQKGLPEGYAYMAEGGNSQDYPDSHDVEFSVYTAGGAIAYAPAGRKGAMPRLRGEWTSGTTYQNQQDYVDVVLYDGAYYQCIAPAGAVTSTTNPKSDTQNWQPFNEYENLATGVLLAGKGLIQVLGAGKAFIGQTETGTGWEMTQGQIRHTGTGLALTADGKLSVPNPGALTITGGQTLEAAGRNLLKNSKYQKTTTEYLVQTCQSYEPLVRGERYTLVAKADFATEGHCLGLWDNKGSYCYTRALPCDEDGYIVYYLTFNYTKGNTAGFSFYHTGVGGSGNGSGSEVTLHWAVLYKGWALPRREWYPAPEEDASAQLTAYKTEVTTELKVMNDQIASKVAQTTFDALGNRVSSAESTLQQHATQIASKVSQTTYEQFQTQTEADLEALGQGSAQNLIPQSRRPSFSPNTLGFTTSYVDDQNLPPGCYTRWSVTKAGYGGYIYARTDNPAGNTRLYPSRTYSWSLHIRSSRALPFRVGHENGGVKSVSLEAGVWTRLTHTFTTSATDRGGAFCIYSQSPLLQPGDTLDFHSLIMVEGAVVPQWVPSPWETQQGIDDAQADATDAQNRVGALTTRVTTAESQITQQAGLIAQKVSQTTFDTFRDGYDTFKQQTTEGLSEVRQTASGIQSTVTSHTTQLTSLGTKIDKAAPFAEVTLDATGLDPDTWYPVTIGLYTNVQTTIRISWALNASAKPPWGTHKSGFSVLAVWQSNGSGWGTQAINRTILEYSQSFVEDDVTVAGGIGQLSWTSEEYIYVRGGGKYAVRTEGGSGTPQLHSSAYTSKNGQTISPITTAPSRPVPDLDTAQQTASDAAAAAATAGSNAQKAQTAANTAQSAANAAKTAADAAQQTANTAKTNAASALTQLTNMSSDNILSPVEKQQTKKEWDAIQSEYTKNTSAASTAGVSSTAYATAYQKLSTYLSSLLASLTTDSAITGTTFRQTFKAYYDARTDLLNAIAKAARDKADSAQSKADSAYQSAQNAITKADGAVTIKDTRKDNQTPGWYGDNYPQQVVREFKETEAIGLKAAFPAVVTETFCTLETYVQWNSGGASDSSGGYPRQTAYSRGRLFTRYGLNATTWSEWRDSTTTLEVETQIDQARDRLWLGVTSNLLNLFRDGSFERDVNTVSNTDAGSSTVSFPAWRDVYEPYDSTTSGQYRDVMPTSARVMAVRNWASGAARVILGQHVPVEPGKTYTVVLWRHDGGTRSAQDGVRWLNVRTPASSPTWTSVELADQQPSWVYGWHREAFVVGPAPAAAQSLQVFLGTASSTAAAWTLVDGVMVVEGDLRTADLLPETFVTDLRSDLSDALYQTGINIATGEVTVQADRFRVRGQNGGTGELLFDTETGLLRTELIDAEALTVSNLAAGRGTIDFLTAPEPGTGGMGVYIGRGAFDEAMSSTSDFTKSKGASLSKTFSHSSGQTGPVNGAVAEHALYTVTAGSSKAATVRLSGQVRVDLSATGRLDTASFGQGVISKLAEGTVTASVALTVGGQTQKFIATGLRCGGPTWDSEYVGGSTVLSNPQSTASRSWTVAVDETVYVPAGQQAKVVVRYSYTLDRKSSSFTANAKITASQSYNTLTATVQTRQAALCADGLMFQTSTANYLRIIPGTGNSSTNGFRLQSATPLQLDAPVALNRLQHKVISSMAQAESSNAAFWANVSLFVFNGTGRFILPDVNLSPQFNHFRLYTKNAVKITTNGTGEMGGLATGLYEYTSTADFIFTLDYIEATKKWVVSLG